MKKNVFVTGASSGIGKAVCKKLAADSQYQVFAFARRVNKMQDLKELGCKIYFLDVTKLKECRKTFKEILKNVKIDVLINNAGYAYFGVFEESTIEDGKMQFETNFFGLANLCQIVMPYMRKQNSGLIIQVSSVVGFIGSPLVSWYSASKWAVEGLTEAIKTETGKFNLNFVLVEPGSIKTEIGGNFKVDESKRIAEYDSTRTSFYAYTDKLFQKASDPNVISDLVVKILSKKHPKLRYYAGAGSYKLKILLFLCGKNKTINLFRKLVALMAKKSIKK